MIILSVSSLFALCALQAPPHTVVLVAHSETKVPTVFSNEAFLDSLSSQFETIEVEGTTYFIKQTSELLLIVDPAVHSVESLLQHKALADALSTASEAGKVSSLSQTAQATLSQKLATNAPAHVKPGSKLPDSLRYYAQVRAEIKLTLDGKSVSIVLTPPEKGMSPGLNDEYKASALSLNSERGAQQEATSSVGKVGIGTTFVALRMTSWRSSRFAETYELAAKELKSFINELEQDYSDSLAKAIDKYRGDLLALMPRQGLSNARLSDLNPQTANGVRQALERQLEHYGFKDQTELERFIALAELKFSPAMSIYVPLKEDGGAVRSFGYILLPPE